MTVYFDNSATTKPCKEAVDAAKKAIEECWGNPSSLHFLGSEANALLRESRKKVASLIKCPENDFYFAPSGTAANNTAIFGTYEKLKKQGNRIITTGFEHPSVSEPLKRLEKQGVEIIRINPEKNGKINADELLSAIDKNTVLVSCMAVNNEVGSVIDVSNVKSVLKREGAPGLVHTDCVQALGKIDVSPKKLGADIITVSAHKIHGLKGSGGLYLREKNIITPYILGGGQEKGVISGTEAMPAVAAFGAAAEAVGNIAENYSYVDGLRKHLFERIADIPCVKINSPADAIPYVINLSVLGLPSQPIVNFMSEKGICISAGSACKMGHRSPVLTAMALSPELIDSAVRISLCRFNTEEEIDILANAITELAAKYGKK